MAKQEAIMPKRAIPLTTTSANQAAPREKLYKLFDGDGLYLEVQPGGSKSWRMKYRQKNGRENVLTFGRYPDISIAQAREYAHTARQMLKHELDPRTEFNWQKLNPPPAPIPLERLLGETDWERVQASIVLVARHTIQHLEATLFPAIANIPTNAARNSIQRASARQIENAGLLDICRRLEDIATALAGTYLRTGMNADELVFAMKDRRDRTRRASDIADFKPRA
jgi:hypothetical protein